MERKKSTIGKRLSWGIGGLLVLWGGMYLGGASRPQAIAEEEAESVRPLYQFWAHFLSILPQDSELWTGDYGAEGQNQPLFVSLVTQLNRDLYNVRSPRRGWRTRSLAEVFAEGGQDPDAAALSSRDPETVARELNRLDPRFRYQVTTTLQDQAPLGELMVAYKRTESVAMEFEGEPLQDPEARIEYDVSVILQVEKIYADGYALMQKATVVTRKKRANCGKGPLNEKKIGEAFNRIVRPFLVRSW